MIVLRSPYRVTKMEIRRYADRYADEEIGLREAVFGIDRGLGPVWYADFDNSQRSFTVGNDEKGKFSIRYREFSNGKEKKHTELAVALWKKAKENGNPNPGSLHISKRLSSKHHAKNLIAFAKELASEAE